MINEGQQIIEEILIGLRNQGVISSEQRIASEIEDAGGPNDARVGLEIAGRHYVITVEDVSS